MAEKHKSKYKKPENTKYKSRKDLKDYTMDDKDEKMNPKSTGEKQSNVLRKTDKPMVDDGKMDVKWNADDRLYKDLEDGEYDGKHAAKVLKKRQDDGEKSSEKNLKDKDYNLTREQKEQLVRQYVRRKIEKVLHEQSNESPDLAQVASQLKIVVANLKKASAEAQRLSRESGVTQHVNHMGGGKFDVSNWFDSDNTVSSFEFGQKINEQTEPEEVPEPNAEVPAPATPEPAPTDAAPEIPTPAPAPTDAALAPTDTAPATGEEELSDESKQAISIEKFVKQLQDDGGNIARIKTLAKVFNLAMKEVDIEDKVNFYKLLKQLAAKKLTNVEAPQETK
jgi:hypothetical protein